MTGIVETIFSELTAAGLLKAVWISGCSSEEVDLVRQQCGGQIPATYEEFLTIAGRRAGRLFEGESVFFPDLMDHQQDAIDLLKENNDVLSLPTGAVVFYFHQGYEFCFVTGDSPDPPVYQYVEGFSEFANPWTSFSAFLRDQAQMHVKYLRTLNF